MLAIVIFSMFVGIAFVTTSRRETLEPLRKLFEALLEISMTVVKWAMFLTPYAVFGLIAQLTAQTGFTTLIGMGVYVLTVLAGLFILLVLFYLAAAVLGRIGIAEFAKAIAPNQLLAFSTSSSAAVIPVSIKTAVEKLGVPQGVAGVVVPLGATVNMAGSALYQSIALIFLAQLSGMYLSVPELALITITVIAASIGAPGTPGVGIVILATIAGDFGISTVGLVLIMGVDRILDMSRTVVNVTGDLAACRVLRGFGNNHPKTPPKPPSVQG
jgi:Na+/H+-dicarboxylate symporter